MGAELDCAQPIARAATKNKETHVLRFLMTAHSCNGFATVFRGRDVGAVAFFEEIARVLLLPSPRMMSVWRRAIWPIDTSRGHV